MSKWLEKVSEHVGHDLTGKEIELCQELAQFHLPPKAAAKIIERRRAGHEEEVE